MSSARFSRQQLRDEALRCGFSLCGLSPAEAVPRGVSDLYLDWLRRGSHAGMCYLERHPVLRFDPRLLLPGAQTVVSLALCYHPATFPTQKSLAWYAQGKDYHDVLRRRMRRLMEAMGLSGRICVDTAPVMEKYWAWRGGIGFIGRHTQLVVPGRGSAYFLGELLLTERADAYDEPLTPSFLGDHCGECHLCEEACPAGALAGHCLDANRCLSYLTIESRAMHLPPWAAPHLRPCFYGCDRCLRACPHLHPEHTSPPPELAASPELLAMTEAAWQALTPEQYRQLFRGSSVKRAKYEGLMRNIRASLP